MNKKEIINSALRFLERTELKGSEVPMFNEVINFLVTEFNNEEKPKSEEPEEEIQDEDQEEQDEEEPVEEITDKKIQKKKIELKDLMGEVDSL